MGVCRYNVMLEPELRKAADDHGKSISRSGSWVINLALKEFLDRVDGKHKPKKKPTKLPAVSEPAVMFIPLNSGEYSVTQSSIDKWTQLYPAANVVSELRSMIGWCDANTSKRKTSAGIERFINGWLKKVQDRGGIGYQQPAGQSGHSRVTEQNIQNTAGWADEY